MTKRDLNRIFKILSVLLQYPGKDLLTQMKEIETIVASLSPNEFKNSLTEFLTYIKAQPLIQLQETYTAAFDMSPATTMNLTYHIWGDNEKRAGMLARLQQVYQDAGYECKTGELPDYLPMMLEFLSVCPEAKGVELIWECLKHFDKFIDRLQQSAPAYSDLLQPLGRVAVRHFKSKGISVQQIGAGHPDGKIKDAAN